MNGYKKASQNWNIDKLFKDINEASEKTGFEGRINGLSKTDKEYLCLLLIDYSPQQISQEIGQKQGTIKTELCNYLYKYINQLLEGKNKKINDWRDVKRLIELAGYRKENPTATDESKLPPSIGWIRIGAVNTLTGEIPNSKTPLIATSQPVTILPMEVPSVGSIITVNEYVNLRVDRPQKSNGYKLPEKVGHPFMKGSRLVILDLDAFIDTKSSVPYTRVWAKVGLYIDSSC